MCLNGQNQDQQEQEQEQQRRAEWGKTLADKTGL